MRGRSQALRAVPAAAGAIEPYEDLPAPAAWFQARAATAGADFDDEAFAFVVSAGGHVERRGLSVAGHPVDGLVRGTNGVAFLVAAHGTPDAGVSPQDGLRRTDTVLKLGCRAVMWVRGGAPPLLVITSALPRAGSAAARYLADLGPDIFDVVAATGDLGGYLRLRRYLQSDPPLQLPLPAPWRARAHQLSLLGDDDGA